MGNEGSPYCSLRPDGLNDDIICVIIEVIWNVIIAKRISLSTEQHKTLLDILECRAITLQELERSNQRDTKTTKKRRDEASEHNTTKQAALLDLYNACR